MSVVDVEDPFFVSCDNGVQPVEGVTSGEQLSAYVQTSSPVLVGQFVWEPLTELFNHSKRSQSIVHGGSGTAKSKITRTFIWMLLRQFPQFIQRYRCRSTTARLIFEAPVPASEAFEPAIHRPHRKRSRAEYTTQVSIGFCSDSNS
ncbi:unnamed protein product [Heligmosomoides polygyrus]|uniref:Myosin motor domain-containing protein n=1 Tax=Heligmosomoides polygyrus TaxID=6339 RepID=A0A183FT34_HELPZ|nr:unnamed protein product [Heligmosomoides polygyrus]